MIIAKRIQYEVTEQQLERIDALMQKTGVRTQRDLINHALSLLGWAVDEICTGRKITSMDEEQQKYKEVVLPFLLKNIPRAGMKIPHPLLAGKPLYPIATVLSDLAGQEGCDGEPYDEMARAAKYIRDLENRVCANPMNPQCSQDHHGTTETGTTDEVKSAK